MTRERPGDGSDMKAGSMSHLRLSLVVRWLCASLVIILAAAYTGAVLTGGITAQRQLSLTHLGLLVVAGVAAALLVKPSALRHVGAFSIGGAMRLEMTQIQEDQAQLKRRQERQEDELRIVRDIFPMLIPDNLLRHLQNLEAGGSAGAYNGGNAVRQELRQLRYMQLIEVLPGVRGIGDIPDGRFEVAAFVRLTESGRQWVTRARDLGR